MNWSSIGKRFRRVLMLSGVLLTAAGTQAQTAQVYIAPYKHDAAGLYTLIQDDFGAAYASGIEQYSDSIAFNRNIPFSFAIITGQCDQADWNVAKQLISHGHQPLNHSHSHICGQPIDWCQAGNWNEDDFDVEIDQSTELIKKNTGKHPAFFIFPFDLFTDTMLTYLEAQNFAGARAGTQGQLQLANDLKPFKLNFNVYRPEQAVSVFDEFADQAVKDKGWAIRVMHGVADYSWGKVSVEDYTSHINHLKALADSNKLWVATLSDALWYQVWRLQYQVEGVKLDAKGRVSTFSFAKQQLKFNYAEANLRTLRETSAIQTLTVVLPQSKQSIEKITQKERSLKFVQFENRLMIEANPEQGEVIIHYHGKK